MVKNLTIFCILILVFSFKENTNNLYNEKQLRYPFGNWGVMADSTKGAINLKKAWEVFKKKRPVVPVVVAIIDTGIDPTHPLIKKNIHYGPFAKTFFNISQD